MNTPKNKTAKQIIQETISFFEEDPSRWGRDSYYNRHLGCYCTLGTMVRVYTEKQGHQNFGELLSEAPVALLRAIDAVSFAMGGYWGEPDPQETIIGFNDEEAEDVNQIIATLKVAEKLA